MRRSRGRPSTKDANAGLRKQLLEIPHRDYSPIIIVIIILLFIKGGGNLYSTSLWMAMATAEVCSRREVLGECKDTSLPFTRVDVRVNAATQFEYHRSGIGRGGVEQVRRKGLGIK